MKKIISSLLVIFISSAVISQVDAMKDPLITKSLTNESIREIKAVTSGGSIIVTGSTTASEMKLEVFAIPNNKKSLSKQEIQQQLDEKYNLEIGVTNNKLTVTAKPKEKITDWKKALNISFTIICPINISTDLSTSGGSITLSNLSGKLDFTTSGGSLNVEKVSGKVSGKTSGGSISLSDSKDDIELTTSGGGIEAKNCDGQIKLSTSGGSIMLKHLNGNVKATTSGGSIEGKDIKGEFYTYTSGGSIALIDMSCSLEASTSGGNIDVTIKELGKYVKLSTSAGNVDLDLPPTKGLDLDLSAAKIKVDKLDSFNGKVNDQFIIGKLNGGGTPVKVSAGSGTIRMQLLRVI